MLDREPVSLVSFALRFEMRLGGFRLDGFHFLVNDLKKNRD